MFSIPNKLNRFRNEIARFIAAGDYYSTPEGVVLHDAMLIQGKYRHYVNGRLEDEGYNLVVDQGRQLMLNVALFTTSKPAALYLAAFAGAYTPVAGLLAIGFTAAATELVSNTEGYSETTRRTWTSATATTVGGTTSVGNTASLARFTIITATSININGFALLDNSTKGGTGGNLVSAYRLAAQRTYYNTDKIDEEYIISWT